MNTFKYFYWNNVLNEKEINQINSILDKNKEKLKDCPAPNTIKTSTVEYIKLKYLKNILQDALYLLSENNRDHYGYNVYPFADNSYVNINTYRKNQEYDWHCDMEYYKSSDLKLTGLINISTSDFTGGELNLLDGTPQSELKELNKPGAMVIFNSFLFHKVNPIKKGIRKTLTIWVKGPAFK